jgi:xylulokinase
MPYALGIDLGTSSIKAVLLDSDGDIRATASADYPLLKPKPGWVEQNPADWWDALCQASQNVIRKSGISNTEIRGVAISGQINGAVFVDLRGEFLRNAIIWLDHRSQTECDWANERAGDLLHSRTLQHLNPVNGLAKVLWVHAHEPDLYAQTDSVLMPKDWLTFRLTGAQAAEITDASTGGAFDLHDLRWSTEILQRLDVNPDLFPPLVDSSEIVGTVNAEAAAATGLAPGTLVCGGGGDMPCMVLGSGVISPGILSVGIGTAGHAVIFAEQLSDAAVNQLWPMCHPISGKYAWLGCTLTGGASLTWFRDSFGATYDELTAEAENAPAGSEGLFFMPWLEGTATPYPDANARGGFLGLSLRHTRGHLVRALMEGVVFDLRHSLECFKSLGLPISEIRMGEGGSRSALWRQIHADVFGHDIRLIDTEDLSAVGAALIASVGSEIFPDFETACEATIKLGETVPCQPEQSAFYEDAYRRYCELYPTLKAWYEKG